MNETPTRSCCRYWKRSPLRPARTATASRHRRDVQGESRKVRRIVEAAGWRLLEDIDAADVARFIHSHPAWSPRTRSNFCRVARYFCESILEAHGELANVSEAVDALWELARAELATPAETADNGNRKPSGIVARLRKWIGV